MSSISSVAVSGLHAEQAVLNASAHNVANTNTPAFRRQQVVTSEQRGGGVVTARQQSDTVGPALEADVVAQLQAKNAFLANLAVFKTSEKMVGTLVDRSA